MQRFISCTVRRRAVAAPRVDVITGLQSFTDHDAAVCDLIEIILGGSFAMTVGTWAMYMHGTSFTTDKSTYK